jgi:hypothetical protein
MSENGRRFAREQRIRVIGDAELTGLLRLPYRPKTS